MASVYPINQNNNVVGAGKSGGLPLLAGDNWQYSTQSLPVMRYLVKITESGGDVPLTFIIINRGRKTGVTTGA